MACERVATWGVLQTPSRTLRGHGLPLCMNGASVRDHSYVLLSLLPFARPSVSFSIPDGPESEAMSAAPRLPLAPDGYLKERPLHTRYYTCYMILVSKLARLCRSGRYYIQDASEASKAVKKSLDAWKQAFKVQFSREWVALLDVTQLEDIYKELYGLAEYLFALNVRRSQGVGVATVVVAIKETVSTFVHISSLPTPTECPMPTRCFRMNSWQ